MSIFKFKKETKAQKIVKKINKFNSDHPVVAIAVIGTNAAAVTSLAISNRMNRKAFKYISDEYTKQIEEVDKLQKQLAVYEPQPVVETPKSSS